MVVVNTDIVDFYSFVEMRTSRGTSPFPRLLSRMELRRGMNRTILERARSMRIHAGLSNGFWAESVNYACYLINRSPNTFLNLKATEEVWSGREVDYSALKVFGCSAYAHIPSDQRAKLDSKSLRCIFLGFEKGVKGYKLWDPTNRKVSYSRDVVFDEASMLNRELEKEVQENSKHKVITELVPSSTETTTQNQT